MIKKLLISSLFVFGASLNVNAQVTSLPFVEGFEENSQYLSQWTQIHEVNDMSWTFQSSPSTGGTTSAYEGSRYANFPSNSHEFDKTKLVSPVLQLSNYTNINLEFYYINRLWGIDLNWIRIYYRTSASGSWQELALIHEDRRTWTSSGTFPLPSDVYQIAIECETDYGYATLVDAVKIDGTLSLNSIEKSTVKMFPNPASQTLNLSHHITIDNVRVFNVLGQEVLAKVLNSNQASLNISDLQNGTYVVEISTADGKSVQKLIKK